MTYLRMGVWFHCLFSCSILIILISNKKLKGQTLSQNSNFFITKVSNNKLFISSLDGLNIYDGMYTKKYHPYFDNIYGNNIQSYFYEDKRGLIWFATYEALHNYNSKLDKIEFQFISKNEDTIKNDYRIFWQKGDSLLIAAGKKYFLFDTKIKKSVKTIELDFEATSQQNFIISDNCNYFLSCTTNSLLIYKIDKNFKVMQKDEACFDAFSIFTIDNIHVLVGTKSGKIILYNFIENKIEFEKLIFPTAVQGICKINKNIFLITSTVEDLIVYDISRNIIVDQWKMKDKNTSNYHSKYTFPYFDKDSIFWIGVDGFGVISKDLKKKKFKLLMQASANENANRVTSIAENYLTDLTAIATRGNGLYLLNKNYGKAFHMKNYSYVFNINWIEENKLIYTHGNKIEMFNTIDFSKRTLYELQEDLLIYKLKKLNKSSFIISNTSDKIYYIDLNDPNKIKIVLQNLQDSTPFLGLEIDKNKNVFISKNEEEIWMCNYENEKLTYTRTLNIPGGILCLVEPNFDDNHWYISNTNGIYKVNKNTFSIEKLKDEKGLLSQTIYGIVEDDHQNFWLSSNQGIIKYNPVTKYIHGFTMADGLQGMEFNTNAYMKSRNGEIWMGGVNGLNVFHPDKVKLSTTKATVCVDEIMLADKVTKVFGVPDYVDEMEVKYGTPFSIYFHAIDYGDIEAARLKYKLIGSDKDYVFVDEFKSNIRYTSLRPGSYTLQILAANSDGIWNPTPKTIAITILPPFWMTWWFIALASLASIGLIYYTIKSYYNRKIEKQNQLLREQTLIIEKQTAIESERSRIASEMHDDLGSGLTRIKYLSDKASSQVRDESEGQEIKKIAIYSNDLIRNMGEIIWAMNSRFDSTEQLFAYIRRHASEYLEEHKMPLKFSMQGNASESITGEKRRNLVLVVKEILHNAVKYSAATAIEIDCRASPHMEIGIREVGGKGFDLSESLDKGNGLYNMQKRMKDIGGEIHFHQTLEFFEVRLVVK